MRDEGFPLLRLYPAPPLTGDGVISRDELERRAHHENDPKAHFALGNLLFRSGNPGGAIKAYLRAIEGLGELPELHANIGLAYAAEGNDDDALLQLRRAVLSQPDLVCAQKAIGEIFFRRRELDLAEQAFEKVLSFRRDDAEALRNLAFIALERKDEVQAIARFEELLRVAPGDEAAEDSLAGLDFARGYQAFLAGDLDAAFQRWGESYRRFPNAYAADREIVNTLRRLVRNYHRERQLKRDLEEFRLSYRANPNDPAPFYRFVARYLFSVGLYPEAWEAEQDLEAASHRWRQSLEERGEHPYPHFRLALINLYRGEVSAAFHELTICQDRLLPKKQRVMKLKELFALAQLLAELQTEKEAFLNMLRPFDEWERVGFINRFKAEPWRESGLSPEVAWNWSKLGFSAKEAVRWVKAGVEPAVAQMWRDAEFHDPIEVRLWIRGGFTPVEAKRWKAECPLSVEAMVESRAAGIDDPGLAYAWSKLFQLPWEARRWHELGFQPGEAAEWIANGFREPRQALTWKERDYSPAAALRRFNEEKERS